MVVSNVEVSELNEGLEAVIKSVPVYLFSFRGLDAIKVTSKEASDSLHKFSRDIAEFLTKKRDA